MNSHASIELCEELYRLSGWDYTDKVFHVTTSDGYDEYDLPVYDVGYLLRKLPASRRKEVGSSKLRFRHYCLDISAGHSTGGWVASYRAVASQLHERKYHGSATAETPEDALTELAIELFKSGILTNTPKAKEVL